MTLPSTLPAPPPLPWQRPSLALWEAPALTWIASAALMWASELKSIVTVPLSASASGPAIIGEAVKCWVLTKFESRGLWSRI